MPENLFMTLLGISVTTSAVILLLKLSSELFSKTYAAKWKYWIWLVLALRLIIPFNFSGQKTMNSRFANILNLKKKKNGAVTLLAVVLTVSVLSGSVACNVAFNENKLLTKLGYTKTLLTDILDNRTTFSQDNEQINQIVKSLPLQVYRKYNSFFVQTEPSKEISIVYEFDDSYTRGGNGLDPFPGIVEENNALLLFAAVEGLDKVNFLHYENQELTELNRTDSYTVEDLTGRFGDIEPLEMGFSDLYSALAANIQLSEYYFGHYSRIYLGVAPESVSYRNGEPAEIRQQSDGSTVWIYPDFGKIYSISPDGSTNPGYTAMYYFNSAAAEKNDKLTGLYATRFINGENYGNSYEDITEVLGLPSTIKDMGSGNKYIAYSLSEGQQRNAYFILRLNKVIEEGVMYGNDYTILYLEQKTSETAIKQPEVKPESLAGYIAIKGDTLYFDQVEIVKLADKERLSELGLTDTDLPNGYMIINENKEEATFELTNEVKYTFTDLDLYFVKESDGDRLYTTTQKDEFLKHLGKLNDFPISEQKIPYFVEVKDGKVISITEKFEYTI